MSIEDTFDRIATALERIAAYANHAPPDPPNAEAPDGLSSNTPADNHKKVVRLARSVATDPGVVAAQAREKAAAVEAATTKAKTNGAAKVVSFEDMRNALVGVKVKLGAETSRAVMGKVGATNVQEIKPEDFGTVTAECARLMG